MAALVQIENFQQVSATEGWEMLWGEQEDWTLDVMAENDDGEETPVDLSDIDVTAEIEWYGATLSIVGTVVSVARPTRLTTEGGGELELQPLAVDMTQRADGRVKIRWPAALAIDNPLLAVSPAAIGIVWLKLTQRSDGAVNVDRFVVVVRRGN